MAYKLKDRKENVVFKKNNYELTLLWGKGNSLVPAKGFFPYKAQILKNGSFFAKIHCFSNGESFAVESCCSIESDWFAVFHHSDINSIPLKKLLELLPI